MSRIVRLVHTLWGSRIRSSARGACLLACAVCMSHCKPSVRTRTDPTAADSSDRASGPPVASLQAPPPAVAPSSPPPVQQLDPVAEAFSGEPPDSGDPVAIYRAGRPSGVIVLVPKEFRHIAPLGEGMVASTSNMQMVATSALSFLVAPRNPSTPELGSAPPPVACKDNLVTSPVWDRGVDVVFGARKIHGRAWKGIGKYGKGPETRFAYLLRATVGESEVTSCAAWNATNPELERVVLAILMSLRQGVAPPADLYGE